MKNTLPGRVRFGAFQLDLKAGELHKDDRRIRLQEQPFQVLQMLVERAGEVVSREEIQNKLWPNDTVVEFDHGINTAIKKLRIALNDSAEKPKYIETVARRGYRLMVSVEWPSAGSDSDAFNPGGAHGIAAPAEKREFESTILIGKTVSHYRVLNVIGGGGMGVVYRAEDLKLGRTVALKFLPEELGNDPVALGRFTREARTASALNHPNICTIYEIEEHEGQPFIVMEYLEGHTLRDLIAFGSVSSPLEKRRKFTLPLERIIDTAIQISEGLEAAHDKGIIHRDIKPANIFVTRQRQVKILDFGLAKLVTASRETAGDVLQLRDEDDPVQPKMMPRLEQDANLTRAGVSIGTAGYMSPEQIEGIQLDPRTDLFCFGLVLYELCTGKKAFIGATRDSLCDAILHQVPIPVRELNPEIPPKLESAVSQCLQKDREHRYQHAFEITRDLKQLRLERTLGVQQQEHSADPMAKAEKVAPQSPPAWVAPPASARAPVPESTGPRSRFRVAVVTAMVITLAAGIFYWQSQRARALTEKDTIVLADFSNTTGDALFDSALRQSLTFDLEGSPLINILSDERVDEQLRYMGQPRDARRTQEVTRQVCQRSGSKAMIVGSISALGSHYLIGLEAIDCATGDSLGHEQEEADNREHITKALSKAAANMRRRLGESLASVQKFNKPEEDATTPSMEALVAFNQARMAQITGEGDPIFYFKRALELDPNLAVAYVGMATAYENAGQTSLAAQNYTKAYELRDRVSPQERLYIEGHYYESITGELEKAVQIYTEWSQNYSGNFKPHINLSNVYSLLGQYDKAIAEALETLRLSPNNVLAYTDLVTDYNALNRVDQAKSYFEKAKVLKLELPFLRFSRYLTGFLQGDTAAMEEQVHWAMGKPGAEDLLLSSQSDTEAYYGRMEKAGEFSQRAVQSAKRAETPEMAATWKANEALREAEVGNASRARQKAMEALAMAPGASVQVVAALALARAGEPAMANKIAEQLDQQCMHDTMMQGFSLPSIRAAIALANNNPVNAVETLQVAVPYELGGQSIGYLYPAYLRGEAYLRSGQAQQAAAEYNKILDHPGIMLNFVTGALAHLQLARAQAMSGDHETARKSYQVFFSLWKGADADIPMLKAAKAEYQRLS